MAKLWGGRFQKDLTENVEDFLQSVEVDSKMVLEDIWGSQAHAIMLAKQDIIKAKDLKEILLYLDKARADYLSGKFVLDPENEDVHMNVERYLIEGAGADCGGKLHTARSRNDQVITDSKLHIRNKIIDVKEKIIRLQETFLAIAEENTGTAIPGYTHTQDAQPITLGYWATAYVSMLNRDITRLDNAYRNVNTNPLGSAALAGTSFPIDRRMTARLLGFDSVHVHSLDVISSRDFVAETLCALAILMSNLSKLAEEIVYWSTYEFGFLELDDSYTAGSSIMPQKKNPCVAELTRGRTGRVYGSLIQLLTTLKGLPMGYNRDLQEDKPPLWNALEIIEKTLVVTEGMISTMQVKKDRLKQVSGANYNTATELANYLVREKGYSFRKCHEIVGNLVGTLHRQNKLFTDYDITLKLLADAGVEMDEASLKNIVDPEKNVKAYKSLGSTNPKEVKRMVGIFKKDVLKSKAVIKKQNAKTDAAWKKTQDIVAKVLDGKEVKTMKI
ncbi:MAG TPA: argininosuccinate lyase [Candidatus Altiarchaeales archaeon]|nr:argininosuccinate lyase [Candidatus Altiarchaeales archaeon]